MGERVMPTAEQAATPPGKSLRTFTDEALLYELLRRRHEENHTHLGAPELKNKPVSKGAWCAYHELAFVLDLLRACDEPIRGVRFRAHCLRSALIALRAACHEDSHEQATNRRL